MFPFQRIYSINNMNPKANTSSLDLLWPVSCYQDGAPFFRKYYARNSYHHRNMATSESNKTSLSSAFNFFTFVYQPSIVRAHEHDLHSLKQIRRLCSHILRSAHLKGAPRLVWPRLLNSTIDPFAVPHNPEQLSFRPNDFSIVHL